MAKRQSMAQLGSTLTRIISLMADNFDPDWPFVFAKLDIKDGFWRLAVSDDDAWNFCYVLPSHTPTMSLDDIDIVVPNCLQMGWCESPPFFCSSSETARDVMEHLLRASNLPAHPMETVMLKNDPKMRPHTNVSPIPPHKERSILEVFVDDFIGATNNTSCNNLTKMSRSMLHGVHSVFPPPEITHHSGADPISEKKLGQGDGTWATRKEILGWNFDGIEYTIQLPVKKCKAIQQLLRKAIKKKRMSLKKFQQLAGKLQHASIGLPSGRCLFSPIQTALLGDPLFINITSYLRQALIDWKYIIMYMSKNPTSVRLLISGYPAYLGYSDSCGLGAGGVWSSGLARLAPFIWRVEWPRDIREMLLTEANPQGELTINDLELAGAVLNWLALECQPVCLQYCHVATFCDNTSAVAWAFKLRTSKSLVAGRLLRLLGLRIHSRKVSSLTPLHIAGENNKMADVVSRAFKSGTFAKAANTNLISYFNSTFPLPQKKLWTEFHIPQNLVSRVISCLRGELLPMGSLIRLPKLDKNIGSTGATMPHSVESTLSSKASKSTSKGHLSSQPLLRGSGQEYTVEELKSWFKASQTRLQPSARPSNWLENPVPSTSMTKFTNSR